MYGSVFDKRRAQFGNEYWCFQPNLIVSLEYHFIPLCLKVIFKLTKLRSVQLAHKEFFVGV